MGNGFLEGLELRPRAARGVQFTALALAPAVLVAWVLADTAAAPWPLRTLPLGLAAVALGLELFAGRRRHPARAVLLQDGSWRIDDGRGGTVAARLRRAWGRAAGPVIALEWDCADGQRRRAWCLRRDAPGPAWRRLRVRLRIA